MFMARYVSSHYWEMIMSRTCGLIGADPILLALTVILDFWRGTSFMALSRSSRDRNLSAALGWLEFLLGRWNCSPDLLARLQEFKLGGNLQTPDAKRLVIGGQS